jgi:chromosome segregation ATPase
MTDINKQLRADANKIARLRGRIATLNAKLTPLKSELKELEDEYLAAMLDAKIEQVATTQVTLAVRRTTFAELFDDQAFFAYVGKRKAWDLVRKQPVVAACRERWDQDESIPGVRPGTQHSLSVTARRKR